MSDEQGSPSARRSKRCRAALLAQYPGHDTVEAIFESGALSPQWRDEDAYPPFGVSP